MIEKLKEHPIEQTPAYLASWDVYNKTSPNTSYIKRQVISRKSAASIHFKQAEKLYTTKSELTTIEGEGLRVNLFVSGCQFRCVNCFNESSQRFGYGEPYTEEHDEELFSKLSLPFVDGITFVGGEPFQSACHLIRIAERIKRDHPDKTIWSYTGYVIEVLLLLDKDDPRRQLLNYVDVLIDGQYIDEERDEADLKAYRGSSNQRLIDVKETIKQRKIIKFKGEDFNDKGN